MFKSLTLIPSKRLQFERFKILIIKLTPNLIPLPLEAVPETLSQTIHDDDRQTWGGISEIYKEDKYIANVEFFKSGKWSVICNACGSLKL